MLVPHAGEVATEQIRVVQVSDTHLSAAAGEPPQWAALRAWLIADPPDLVVHTGDIVLEDPDDEADRITARHMFDGLDLPQVFIPGNHDVGFYDEPQRLPVRLDAFRRTWGDDRFVRDIGAWRLIGVNAYLLGHDSPLGRVHDRWFAETTRTGRFTMVFVHQPPLGDIPDEWEMPAHASKAFADAIADRNIVLIASGHRHCAALRTIGPYAIAWAPSLTLRGDDTAAWLDEQGAEDIRPDPGALEHRFFPDGTLDTRIIPL